MFARLKNLSWSKLFIYLLATQAAYNVIAPSLPEKVKLYAVPIYLAAVAFVGFMIKAEKPI